MGAKAILEMTPFSFLYITLPKESLDKMPSHKHCDGLQIADVLDLCLMYYFSTWPCFHGLVSTSRVSSQREVIPDNTTENCVEGFCVEPTHGIIQSVIEFYVLDIVLWS